MNPSVVARADQRQPRPLAVVVRGQLLLGLEHPWEGGALQLVPAQIRGQFPGESGELRLARLYICISCIGVKSIEMHPWAFGYIVHPRHPSFLFSETKNEE